MFNIINCWEMQFNVIQVILLWFLIIIINNKRKVIKMVSVGYVGEELEFQCFFWSNISSVIIVGSGLVVDYGVIENEVLINNGDRFWKWIVMIVFYLC